MPLIDQPPARDPWLAALVIGALALAGAMGAMRAGGSSCAVPSGAVYQGAPITPIDPPQTQPVTSSPKVDIP